MLRAVKIPDVRPSDIPPGADFSLVAGIQPLPLCLLLAGAQLCMSLGDFEEIYGDDDADDSESHTEQWDAVLTCFFIDTVRVGSASL
jgi:carnosine N-methyltransferase